MTSRSTTTRVRAAASTLAAVLLLGGVPAVAATGPGGDPPSPGGQVEAPVPQIAWGPCDGAGLEAFECASVEVPTDYDRPQGRRVRAIVVVLPCGRS